MSLLKWISAMAPVAPAPPAAPDAPPASDVAPTLPRPAPVASPASDALPSLLAAIADATPVAPELPAAPVAPAPAAPAPIEARRDGAAFVALTGDTYAVREAIRVAGGRWHAASKTWYVPAAIAADVQAIVPAYRGPRPAARPDVRPAAPVARPARRSPAMVLVTGDTYPVREALKAMGARWDAREKGWRVPADRADEANALVVPQPAPRAARRAKADCGWRPGMAFCRGNDCGPCDGRAARR